MADPQTAPAPLHIPAILQNPVNASLRQVEAHNAQQREKAAARREARAAGPSSSGSGKGKRVLRRHDNATFAANPHIVQPKRSDFYPPVPLQPRALKPTFPASVLPRSEHMASASESRRDPFAQESINGAFGTSLKGVRALLRRRGRRAEHLVGVIEGQMRGWLAGDWELNGTSDAPRQSGWRAIDPTDLVLLLAPEAEASGGAAHLQPQSLPTHRSSGPPLPPLPRLDATESAYILESSRSPAHLSWHVPDSFDRLVTHLVARYYELVSWSADQPATDGSKVRMTHIVVPSIARPAADVAHGSRAGGRAGAAARGSGRGLLTPETTDLSGLSASDTDRGLESSVASLSMDEESEAATEIGDSDLEGYSLDPEREEADTTVIASGAQERSLVQILDRINLEGAPLSRVTSTDSSMYASSEGGSDVSGLADSLTFDPPPPGGPIGWESGPVNTLRFEQRLGSVALPQRLPQARVQKTWEDKPTFFEYLYGE